MKCQFNGRGWRPRHPANEMIFTAERYVCIGMSRAPSPTKDLLFPLISIISRSVLRSFAESPPLSFSSEAKNLGGDSLWMTMLRSFADLRREQATRPTEKETLSFPNKINSTFCIIVPFLLSFLPSLFTEKRHSKERRFCFILLFQKQCGFLS